jgi:hypothetical protein
MKLNKWVVGCVLASVGTVAQAQFADNFDSNSYALGVTSLNNGWQVFGGNVDVVGPNPMGGVSAPPFGGLCQAGQGMCIDLNGTGEMAPAQLQNSAALVAGTTYDLTFQLAGNQRGGVNDLVTVVFGGVGQTFTLGATSPWQTYSLLYTATSSSPTAFSFTDYSSNIGSNVGAVLDNVQIAAVPEPETWALMGLGLAILGGAAWRRTRGLSFNASASAA